MAVHLTGRPMDMFKINKIAKKHKLIVIEDAAQSIGAKFKNQKIGSFGDFGCFSFQEIKIMTTGGDGGMISTNKTKYIANNLKITAIVILISKEIRLFATNNKSARRLALIPKNA